MPTTKDEKLDEKLKEQKRNLRDAITSSDQFRKNEPLRRLLDYLFERHLESQEPIEPQKIFDKLYQGSQGNWKNIVKVLVSQARAGLAAYFSSESGKSQKLRVEIDRNKYRLLFTETTSGYRDHFKVFWDPYYNSQMPSPNIIVFAEPLFFRHEHTYINDDLCNDGSDRHRLSQFMGGEQWEESYHYASSGDVMAILALMKKFREKNLNLEYGTVRQYPVRDLLTDRHVILVGSGRTNPLIRDIQRDHRFILSEQGVEADGSPDYPKTDDLEPKPGSKYSRLNKYAVLTRLRERKDRCITVIAANHGRAAQGVVEDFITFEPNLEKLLANLGVDSSKSLPSHFQVVFRVAILKESGEATIDAVDPIDVNVMER